MTTALRTTPTKSTPRRSPGRSSLRAVSPAAYPMPARVNASPLQVVPRQPHAHSAPAVAVKQLPTRRPLPTWLRLLIQLQRGSVIVTFVLVTAALVVYGSTIYMQQRWSKDYSKLKSMQRSERTMIAAGEFLKNQLIQQAEQPGSGLVPRTAAHTIVLEPEPARTVPATANPVLKVDPGTTNSAPLGY